MLRNLLSLIMLIVAWHAGFSQLIVNNTSPFNDAANLVANVLAPEGITVSNVTFSGSAATQIGYFNGTLSNLGLDSGIVLCSGDVALAAGANTSTNSSFTVPGGTSDPDLFNVAGASSINDACYIEFDFVPDYDSVEFKFVFGSEEYPEFLGSTNDVAGIFVSGPGITGPYSNNSANIAVLPDGITAITTANINNGATNTGPCVNCAYYVDNTGGTTVEYDAFTTVLIAKIMVTPGQTYHIKIAVGDAVDATMDSGLFFSAVTPTVFRGVVQKNNVKCNSACDGTISVDLRDGQTPYTYVWSDGATTLARTGLCPGTYNITASDATITTTVAYSYTITEPSATSITTSSTNLNCNAICDGSISGITQGGTTPYSYLWSNTSTSQTVTGVCSALYILTVTDNNSCAKSSFITVSEPAQLVLATIIKSNVSCNNACNGSITAIYAGGTASNSVLWSTAITGNTVTGLCAGVYLNTVTDANGCAISESFTITEPATLIVSATTSNVLCFAGSDGAISLTTAGGSTPYNYLWSNSTTLQLLNGLVAGLYAVTITDNNGCDSIVNITITEPASTSNYISGTITYNSAVVSDGEVILFKAINNTEQWDTVAIAQLGAFGEYSFSDIDTGNYVVMANLDNVLHPLALSTYYPDTWDWTIAYYSLMACSDTFNLSIDVIQIPGAPGGQGSIGGYAFYGSNGKMMSVGDPIPGLEIMLDKTPPSAIMGITETDSLGHYEFLGLDTGYYKVIASLPGVQLDSVHEIHLTIDSLHFGNANYYVDTPISKIVIADTVIVLFQNPLAKIISNQVKIYPNPTNGKISVLSVEKHSYQLLDVFGRLVKTSSIHTRNSLIDLTGNANGSYLLIIRDEQGLIISTGRIIYKD